MSNDNSDQKRKNLLQMVAAGIGVIAATTAALASIVKDSNEILVNLPFSESSSAILPSPSSTTPSSSDEQMFYVIALQSEYPEELSKEPIRAAGLEFTHSFPNIKICPSKVDAKTYYLVIDSTPSRDEAEAIKQQAIVNKFNSETYVQSENEIFFVPRSCSSISG